MVTMSLISGNAKRQSTTGSRSVVKRSIEISFSVEEHHDPYDIDSDSDINDVL
jgi:hypothetical protein